MNFSISMQMNGFWKKKDRYWMMRGAERGEKYFADAGNNNSDVS